MEDIRKTIAVKPKKSYLMVSFVFYMIVFDIVSLY